MDCHLNSCLHQWFYILCVLLPQYLLRCLCLALKIGPQCVLGVLCWVLFLSVGMLFSNIRIWELNCYKCEHRQVITIFEGKLYGRILFTLSSSLIKACYWRLWCKKGIYGQFHKMDITFRGQFLEIKLFLTHFCLKLEQVFITWYFTISRKKNYDFILKSCQIFLF